MTTARFRLKVLQLTCILFLVVIENASDRSFPSPLRPQASSGYKNEETFSLRRFAPTLTATQRSTLLETLRVLVTSLDALKASYYICGGSLLGSYRHHGFVPWDDDVDVCVWKNYVTPLRKLIQKTYPRYRFIDPKERILLKFFSKSLNDTSPIPGKSWRAPFVDVWVIREDGEHLLEDTSRINKTTVLPLGRRPFAGMTLRAPHHTAAYLRHYYVAGKCRSISYSHLKESVMEEPEEIDCKLLYGIYPFVFRSKALNSGHTLETLRFGNVTCGSVTVDDRDSLL